MKITELESKIKSNANILKTSMKIPCNSLELLKEEDVIMSSNRKKFSIGKKVVWSAVSVAAVFVLMVNCVPSIAYAGRDIPVLDAIIKVVTFGRYEVSNGGVEANIVTPQIEGLLNKELQDKLNNEFKEHSQSIIAAFEKDIKTLEKEYGDDFHLGVDANYMVRTDNEDVLAIDTYIVNTVASSSTKHSFYTINKKTGELVELENLFKEDADYITPISEYITSEMRKLNENGTGGFWIGSEGSLDGFEKIKPDQNFFINDLGNIVICFDKYEVAIGAQGSPEFEIPGEVVKNILK